MIVFPSFMINAQFPTLDFLGLPWCTSWRWTNLQGWRSVQPRDWVPFAQSLSHSNGSTEQVIVFRLDRLVVSKCLWHCPTRMINLNWFIFFRWIETAKPPNFYGIFWGAQGPLIPILMVTSPIQLPSLWFRGFRNFHQPPMIHQLNVSDMHTHYTHIMATTSFFVGSTWFNMVQHGSTWFNMVQHGSTWFNMVQHGSTWFNMVQHGSTWFNHRGSAKGASKVWSISGGGACTLQSEPELGTPHILESRKLESREKQWKTWKHHISMGIFQPWHSICRDCFPPLRNWNTRAHELQLRDTPWLVALLFTLQTLLHCFSLLSALLLLLHYCSHSYYWLLELMSTVLHYTYYSDYSEHH